MSEHSETPWMYRETALWAFEIFSAEPTRGPIAETKQAYAKREDGALVGLSQNQIAANAVFIVRAANSHEALVAALEDIAAKTDLAASATNDDVRGGKSAENFRIIGDVARAALAAAAQKE